MAKTKYLVPFCVLTGGVPHYLERVRGEPVLGGKSTARCYGYVEWGADGEVEWREPTPFVPVAGTAVTTWRHGRSAANVLLHVPVLASEARLDVRTTYYTGQGGLVDLMKAGAFDGPVLRAGALLVPVKRGQNYLVEFGGWAQAEAGPRTVAVDFDGTIYAGPFTAADEVMGPPLPGAIAWLRAELSRGHKLIVHTCRLTTGYDGCSFPADAHRDPHAVVAALRAWFVLHGLTAAEVDALDFWTRPGKPWAHEYLDDKAVRFSGTYPERT